MDLNDLASVRQFAANWMASHPALGMHCKFAAVGITANAVHPGRVMTGSPPRPSLQATAACIWKTASKASPQTPRTASAVTRSILPMKLRRCSCGRYRRLCLRKSHLSEAQNNKAHLVNTLFFVALNDDMTVTLPIFFIKY